MQIEDGRVVFIQYKLTDSQDNLLDESPEDEPMAYLHGAVGIVPGLEAELKGKKTGDEFDVTIAPEDAYGEHNPAAVHEVTRSSLPEGADIQVGMQVTQDSRGTQTLLTITAVGPDIVTLDANHPLAGKTLRFQGSVVDIREATPEELELM